MAFRHARTFARLPDRLCAHYSHSLSRARNEYVHVESSHRIVDIVMRNAMLALILGYGDERTLSDYATNLSGTHNEKLVHVPTGDIRENEGMYAVNPL